MAGRAKCDQRHYGGEPRPYVYWRDADSRIISVQINEAVNHYIEDRERADVPVSVNEVGSGDFIGDVMARAIALGLRDRKGLDAVSTITPHTLVDKLVSSGLGLSGVAHVILDGLPIPD